MSLDDDDLAEICATLREEASEQVERIGEVLLQIEQRPGASRNRALLDEAFRQAHNLKGASASLGFTVTAKLAHGIESALAELRERPVESVREVFDTIHSALSLVPGTLEPATSANAEREVDALTSRLVEARRSLMPRAIEPPSSQPTMPESARAETTRPRAGFAPPSRPDIDKELSLFLELPAPPTGSLPVPERAVVDAVAARPVSEPPRRASGAPTELRVASSPAMAATIGVDRTPDKRVASASAGEAHPDLSGRGEGTVREAVRQTVVPPREAALDAARSGRSDDTQDDAPSRLHAMRAATSVATESEAIASSHDETRPSEDTLRVSTRKLGALMAQVGELLAARLRTDQRLSELRAILATEEETIERLATQRSAVHDTGSRDSELGFARATLVLEEATNEHKQLVRRLRELVRSFEADALHSTILSGELQEDIRRIQTFPLASVLGPMPRAVRNMAREVGKDVELAVVGGELELDKKVLESLRDPLYHLLRNAIDHGIETQSERKRRGKPERGRIVLRADHLGDSVTITVEDDGGGVDLEAVRKRARERGLLSEQAAAQAGEHVLLDLVFSPGFSTRRVVSSMSGRGVGLDAVRKSVEQLRGSVTMQTRRGQGSLASITLPLTIYVVHALILRIGEDELAIPISSVQRIMRVRAADVLTVEQCPAILVDGRPVALIPLARLLGLEADARTESEVSSVVVIGAGDQRCALVVDEIVGDQTVLAKNLEPPLVRVPNIAGATIRGDGSVLLALSPVDLLHRANELRAEDVFGIDAMRVPERARLLLVDDSFTTRALERSVLEAAGFDVVAVASGEDALVELERDVVFDGVVSDVQMPGIDGFELCRRIRASDRHRSVPVVLVTSLGSPEDRRRGLEAGADSYVVKAEFDHELLVSRLRELLGRD